MLSSSGSAVSTMRFPAPFPTSIPLSSPSKTATSPPASSFARTIAPISSFRHSWPHGLEREQKAPSHPLRTNCSRSPHPPSEGATPTSVYDVTASSFPSPRAEPSSRYPSFASNSLTFSTRSVTCFSNSSILAENFQRKVAMVAKTRARVHIPRVFKIIAVSGLMVCAVAVLPIGVGFGRVGVHRGDCEDVNPSVQ